MAANQTSSRATSLLASAKQLPLPAAVLVQNPTVAVRQPAGPIVFSLQQMGGGQHGTRSTGSNDSSVSSQFNVSRQVICPTVARKTSTKVFMLRNLNRLHFSPMTQLRNEILNQLGPKIVSETHPFDAGYLKGTTRVCIHSEDDLIEISHKIGRGEACALWCDGVVEGKSSSKPPVTTVSQTWDSSYESDAEDSSKSTRRKKKKLSALEEKNARIEEFIVQLKDKHKDSFNRIQYRLWAEMLDVGTHKS